VTTDHPARESAEPAESDAVMWRYSAWSGSKATVVAATVEFTPTHVVWRDSEGSVVLAERPEQVNELAQVGTLGSSTRGTRPSEAAR